VALAHAEIEIPAAPFGDPVLVPALSIGGGTKNSISICSNSRMRKRKFRA